MILAGDEEEAIKLINKGNGKASIVQQKQKEQTNSNSKSDKKQQKQQ